jgi:hypothetical protein
VAEYYHRQGRLFSVDGSLPVDTVSEMVFQEIESRVGMAKDGG